MEEQKMFHFLTLTVKRWFKTLLSLCINIPDSWLSDDDHLLK